MANAFRTNLEHSAEYFGDTRDHWWNRDYIDLIGKRFSFGLVHDVLDVGCGVGHWGHVLASALPDHARIVGIDAEEKWVQAAMARTLARAMPQRFDYQVASAEKLPFAEASFDLVTCQTVLIHTADPGVVIDEMIRVVRPGGLVLVAEPNNVVGTMVRSSVDFGTPIDDVIGMARFQLTCERGKAALGEGNNSIGDLVPGLFAERGLADLHVYLNDKSAALLPPYDSPEQRAAIQEGDDFEQREFWIWSRLDTYRYFLAGGGKENEFEAFWSTALSGGDAYRKAIADKTFSHPGGGVGYLVAGRKLVGG